MSQKYKIAIIDEQTTEIDQFANFLELSDEFDIHGLSHITNIDDLSNYILENDIDAVAFDYRLMEYHSPFTMNGDKFIRLLLDRFQNFPSFILTNKVQDAKAHQIDPFRVIDKEIINIDPGIEEERKKGLDLINNIKRLIDNYRTELKEKEDELRNLIEKQRQGPLSALEQQRLIELDNFIENTISKTERVPAFLKNQAGLTSLSELVNKTEQILKEIKKDDA